jgi:hypothetical protein
MSRKTFGTIIGLIIIAFLVYYAYRISDSFFKPNLEVNLSQSSVVLEMQKLNRMETAQFTLEKIIDAGYQGNFFQNILYGDRILLIAHAEVIAGFDMAKLTDDDIEIDNNKLTIKMPAPEILFSVLDNSKTRVYDRRTGFLAADDKNLESQARAQAEIAVRQDACEAGILSDAITNGEAQLELLFKTAGFSKVIIITPEGTCN